MTKQDIIDYVTMTPHNSNKAVLSSMLDSVESGVELPKVTIDDNGKVLAVVEGKWDIAEQTNLNNLVDGVATGSLKSINSSSETESYSLGANAVALGKDTKASGENSFAEGIRGVASAQGAHTEGGRNEASGVCSHAEGGSPYAGTKNTASGNASHAEGANTQALGIASHAEGRYTYASGQASHAEGTGLSSGTAAMYTLTMAAGEGSHAEGAATTAAGDYSHSEGFYTIANYKSQHVFGECNIAEELVNESDNVNRGTYIEIVGNGSDKNNRSNARTLDWNGNESLQGSLTLGKGTADEVTITAAQLKALIALLG